MTTGARTAVRRPGDRRGGNAAGRTVQPAAADAAPPSVHDALDLVDRVGVATDRQQGRRLGEIDRIDHARDLGRNGHGVVVGVLGRDRDGIIAIGPLGGAVTAEAVPYIGLVLTGGYVVGAAERGLAVSGGN